ncbi:holocytochrome c-type synthase isoform X1 [Hydra vulgaris]|uniref:holocytochrome c-type synthase isoform X1 n=1 Tax=Hydra vulgaris TaxID=6087 RepID=UPI001F5E8CF6|nr:holocytochrome c-type synthase-like [Hydra vulgaris]
MGNTSATPEITSAVGSTALSPPSGCPMHETNVQSSACPMNNSNSEADKINPLNMMPPANQQPSPGQPFQLSTHREVSSIPKGGVENPEKWVYPSQQMFWNAMLRKGWRWEKDDLSPEDMANIIRMHNANNERAWQEVLKWESFNGECNEPKLLKFGGKAKEYSPRARIRALLGYDLPFDRHDWIVDRNGKQVRYIIDYYDIGDENGYKTGDFVELDVRPAFDSFSAVVDRSRAASLRWAAEAMAWWNQRHKSPEVK